MKFLVLALLVGCAPDYQNSDVKLVGVGYNPEEIGPPSEPSGGILEYSYVDFAGAALSLGMMGFASTDPIGPDMGGYGPPYNAVSTFGYVFSEKLPGAESVGLTAVPPEVEDSCYTAWSTSGPLGSFETVDVGSKVSILSEDGTSGVNIDRYPTDYPGDAQDAFVYYISFEQYRAQATMGHIPGETNKPDKMSEVILQPANFPFGQELNVSFPGGFAPDYAPISSMPLPSSSAGETRLRLPTDPGGIMMSWNGPRYNAWGQAEGADGAYSTCLMYRRDDTLVPGDPADCTGMAASQSINVEGQMYTGPWDTTDGNVTFKWVANEASDDVVSLSVRFLGPVDEEDPAFKEEVVVVPSNGKSAAAWATAQTDGAIPADYECPDGRRAPTPCETEGAQWLLDDNLHDVNGKLVPWMRGDPNDHLAEVTCRVKDDGEFVLTSAMVEEALTYGRAHGAQGAVFYFSRGVQADMTVPDVRDSYNKRHTITPVKLASRAVEIGRFWFEE